MGTEIAEKSCEILHSLQRHLLSSY